MPILLQAPDQPIQWASEGFIQLTGYSSAEIVGRNCRFLQGPRTDRARILEIKDAVRAGQSLEVGLVNYRKDGCVRHGPTMHD